MELLLCTLIAILFGWGLWRVGTSILYHDHYSTGRKSLETLSNQSIRIPLQPPAASASPRGTPLLRASASCTQLFTVHVYKNTGQRSAFAP